MIDPNSSILQSTAEEAEQQQPPSAYYPSINASAHPAAIPGSEEQLGHAPPYGGEVHYYNPYGYSYMNPYEGYDDGRRVYY